MSGGQTDPDDVIMADAEPGDATMAAPGAAPAPKIPDPAKVAWRAKMNEAFAIDGSYFADAKDNADKLLASPAATGTYKGRNKIHSLLDTRGYTEGAKGTLGYQSEHIMSDNRPAGFADLSADSDDKPAYNEWGPLHQAHVGSKSKGGAENPLCTLSPEMQTMTGLQELLDKKAIVYVDGNKVVKDYKLDATSDLSKLFYATKGSGDDPGASNVNVGMKSRLDVETSAKRRKINNSDGAGRRVDKRLEVMEKSGFQTTNSYKRDQSTALMDEVARKDNSTASNIGQLNQLGYNQPGMKADRAPTADAGAKADASYINSISKDAGFTTKASGTEETFRYGKEGQAEMLGARYLGYVGHYKADVKGSTAVTAAEKAILLDESRTLAERWSALGTEFDKRPDKDGGKPLPKFDVATATADVQVSAPDGQAAKSGKKRKSPD